MKSAFIIELLILVPLFSFPRQINSIQYKRSIFLDCRFPKSLQDAEKMVITNVFANEPNCISYTLVILVMKAPSRYLIVAMLFQLQIGFYTLGRKIVKFFPIIPIALNYRIRHFLEKRLWMMP